MLEPPRICADQVVVVTGAGRGIGRSHALAFAAAGARIVVNDLGVSYAGEAETASPADGVVEEIRRAGGEGVADYQDIASWRGAEALLEMALCVFGRVDILVNNAAIIRPAPLIDTREEDWDEVMRVNIKGTFCPSRVFAKHWIDMAKGGGTRTDASIVCTTSRVGLYGTPYYLGYGCSKAAVAYFVSAAAAELATSGIRVNGIAPRADTRMMADATRRLIEVAGDEGVHAVFGALCSAPPSPNDRQDPSSISPLAVWLGSSKSKPISGKVFAVAGGRIALQESWREGLHVDLPPLHTVSDIDRTIRAMLERQDTLM
jgi:NAD(P)-dependent dehydrogenase (short-subunit alcohol dehydrogenase family)